MGTTGLMQNPQGISLPGSYPDKSLPRLLELFLQLCPLLLPSASLASAPQCCPCPIVCPCPWSCSALAHSPLPCPGSTDSGGAPRGGAEANVSCLSFQWGIPCCSMTRGFPGDKASPIGHSFSP